MGRPSTWTAEQNATLRRLWAEGWTSRQIAPRLGLSRGAVLDGVRRLRLLRGPAIVALRHTGRPQGMGGPAVSVPVVLETAVTSRDVVVAWAREHAPEARTLGEVNAVRDRWQVPRFVMGGR